MVIARLKRSFAAAAMSCFLIVGVPAAGSAAEVQPLAGTTTIRVTGTSAIEVHIPAEARLSLAYTPGRQNFVGAQFDDGGTFAAVVIAAEDVQSTSDALTMVRLPASGDPQRPRVVALGPDLCNAAPSCVLEAGLYTLYAVTQGSSFELTLHLQGLSDAVTVAPNLSVSGLAYSATHEYLRETPYQLGVGVSGYGAGFFTDFPTDSEMAFYSFWFRGASEPFQPVGKPLLQVGAAGACSYGQEPPGGTAFAPGCPGGFYQGGATAQRILDDYRYLQWGQFVGVPRGRHGFGGFAVHTGIRNQGFVGFRLGLGSVQPRPEEPSEPAAESTISTPSHNEILPRRHFRAMRGSASANPDTVELALKRTAQGRCKWWDASQERLAEGPCDEPVWFEAAGTNRWSYDFSRGLPRGSYEGRSRAVNHHSGHKENCCQVGRNLVAFRLR